MNMRTGMLAGAALLLLGASAQGALLGRVPLTPGGTDYQAYYDTALDITWVADANLARTSGYTSGSYMEWGLAASWIGFLNSANYLGVDNWRLPDIIDTGAAGCDHAYSGTDCGWNVQTKSGSTVYSEMAHLYYVTLGNLGYYDISGVYQLDGGLVNTGPFSNLHPDDYWSGTPYGPSPTMSPWHFSFYGGYQGYGSLGFNDGAWAVRDGDITSASAVPVPAALWLFSSARAIVNSGVRSLIRRQLC